jgi:predicted nicotinamide N-methyase
MTPEALVRAATSWAAVPFVPEIRLLTAAEPFGLWDHTQREDPPFWAFPWAGGQALARYLLDHPGTVAGRHVLDVASGSGLVAIAAAKAGAARVTAGDVDPNAVAAIEINARANGTAVVTPRAFDLAAPGDSAAGTQVVLAADVFYQRELAGMALRFLRRAAGGGAGVLVADPGRAFLPAADLTPLACYEVPVLSVLEDTPVKTVTVYRLALRAVSHDHEDFMHLYTRRNLRDHERRGRGTVGMGSLGFEGKRGRRWCDTASFGARHEGTDETR